MSLLREIQIDLASAAVDVTIVLRKCKILAARLGSKEFAQWVDWELSGYPESQPIPEYRRLSITYYASFSNSAWSISKRAVPLQLVPEKHREQFQYVEFSEGIAKAASFVREKRGAIVQKPEMIFALQGTMYPGFACQGVWGEIAEIEFEQLVSAVKNRILDFALKIEDENPNAGEALPNSRPVPTEKLQPLVQNTFFGPVGNLAQNSQHFSQATSGGLDTDGLSKLVNEITNHLAELNLDAHQMKRAEAQIAALKAETIGNPDPTVVTQAGRTLRNITEGAIGSLLATATQPGIWQWIQQALANF